MDEEGKGEEVEEEDDDEDEDGNEGKYRTDPGSSFCFSVVEDATIFPDVTSKVKTKVKAKTTVSLR